MNYILLLLGTFLADIGAQFWTSSNFWSGFIIGVGTGIAYIGGQLAADKEREG